MSKIHCCFCDKCLYCPKLEECVRFFGADKTEIKGHKEHECNSCCKDYHERAHTSNVITCITHEVGNCGKHYDLKQIQHPKKGKCSKCN